MKPQKLVTKEWLAAKVAAEPSKVIGRALVALLNYQTDVEQSNATTIKANGVGFSKPDARVGTIGAKQFLKYGTIANWQINFWSEPRKKGIPKICKYANQLNEIANAKLLRVTNP